MPATDEQKRFRAEQEYQFLATLLGSPEKLPLVAGRLDPARFDVPIVAQIVKAIAESYAANKSLSLDDLRSRLTPQENAEIETVIAYSAVLADDREILAVLDRPEGTACGEASPRAESIQASSEPAQDSGAGPIRTARPTRTKVRGPHASPPSQSSREEIERAVMAALVSTRQPGDISRLDPKLFETPALARIAAAMVRCLAMHRCVRVHELVSDLSEKEDQLLVYEFDRTGPAWAHKVDIIAVLTGQLPPPSAETKTSSPQVQPCCARLAEFEAEPRRWLWPQRMELGQLTLIGGEVGSGKTLIACDLAARTTTGGPWPDGAAASTPGSVLLVASEHDVSRLIRPRLEAAGADIERVHVLAVDRAAVPRRDDSPFQVMLKTIEGAIEKLVDCRLVVIDPLRLTIGRTATTVGDDPQARLEWLAALARRECLAVLGMTSAVCLDHRRSSLSDALRSAASTCSAAAWQIVRHTQYRERRLFLPAKTTRSSDRTGLAFKIVEQAAGEGVEWQEQPVPCDCLDTSGDGAAGWLRQALAAGPLASKDLLALGGQNGYTSRMLHYAKLAAGVAITREGFGPGAIWRWNLVASNGEHARTA